MWPLFLSRTPRGRCATFRAYEHLGINPPALSNQAVLEQMKIGDDETLRIGSCAAFAPSDDPEIAIIIIVDEPSCENVFGSYVAAPYVANCLEKMLPVLGVEPDYSASEAAKLEVEVGNYLGMMSFSARELIEKAGLNVEIIGNGEKVTAQVPSFGSYLSKLNGKIIL